jgi:hypothetical protein
LSGCQASDIVPLPKGEKAIRAVLAVIFVYIGAEQTLQVSHLLLAAVAPVDMRAPNCIRLFLEDIFGDPFCCLWFPFAHDLS